MSRRRRPTGTSTSTCTSPEKDSTGSMRRCLTTPSTRRSRRFFCTRRFQARARLKLIAVEYLVPLAAGRPAGFTGPADAWREDTERFGLWELTVWIWEHNPMGMFAHLNPRVP